MVEKNVEMRRFEVDILSTMSYKSLSRKKNERNKSHKTLNKDSNKIHQSVEKKMAEKKSEHKRECLWCRKLKGYRGFEAKAHQCRECMKRVEECIMKEKDPRLMDWGISVDSPKVEAITTEKQELENKVEELRSQMEAITTEKQELERKVEELKSQMEKIKIGQQRKVEQEERIKELESEVKNYMKMADSFTKSKDKSEKELQEWQEAYEELKQRYNDLLSQESPMRGRSTGSKKR